MRDVLEKIRALENEMDKVQDQATDKIVSITSGQIDKVTAMKMIRCRHTENAMFA